MAETSSRVAFWTQRCELMVELAESSPRGNRPCADGFLRRILVASGARTKRCNVALHRHGPADPKAHAGARLSPDGVQPTQRSTLSPNGTLKHLADRLG